MNELIRLPCSKKAIQRDIALIREAGVTIKFCPPRYYVRSGNLEPPKLGENSLHNQQLEKLNRLFYMMEYLDWADCDLWYHEKFPQLSHRTMLRDFEILNEIGYTITYERELFNGHDAGQDLPINHYYYDVPDTFYPFDKYIERYSNKQQEE